MYYKDVCYYIMDKKHSVGGSRVNKCFVDSCYGRDLGISLKRHRISLGTFSHFDSLSQEKILSWGPGPGYHNTTFQNDSKWFTGMKQMLDVGRVSP